MTKSDNQERQERILDGAAELFIHYGYDKTTVSDIALAAGVSKGAIYLHFDSKDDLLEHLIIREMKVYAEKWLALLAADPRGGTIAGMYKNSLYALDSSAFMGATFKQDGRVFGNYMRKPDNFFRDKKFQGNRYEFVAMMQEAGGIRRDLDAKVIAHIMDILAYGLVGMGDLANEDTIPPTGDLIEGIAAIMDRALTPEDGGNPEAGKAIIRQLADASLAHMEATQAQEQQLEQDQEIVKE